MRFARWVTEAAHTHSKYVILGCFSTATVVTRTRLIVRALPVLFLFCCIKCGLTIWVRKWIRVLFVEYSRTGTSWGGGGWASDAPLQAADSQGRQDEYFKWKHLTFPTEHASNYWAKWREVLSIFSVRGGHCDFSSLPPKRSGCAAARRRKLNNCHSYRVIK